MRSLLMAFLLSLLPGRLKIAVLRWRGAQIGQNCRIGLLAIIDARTIILGDEVMIAGFNLLHRLEKLEMQTGSRMNGFNWVTGARTGSLHLGRNTAITRLHFFEASGDVFIGDNTIIAGRGSHFFTHGISAINLDDVRPIRIGPWSYIGSSTRFVPGSGVARGTFVGMGAVVTRMSTEEYILLAGNPARMKKQLSPADLYFNRAFLPHDHHSAGYDGGDTHDACTPALAPPHSEDSEQHDSPAKS